MAADRKHIALGDLMMLAATMIFGAMTIFSKQILAELEVFNMVYFIRDTADSIKKRSCTPECLERFYLSHIYAWCWAASIQLLQTRAL